MADENMMQAWRDELAGLERRIGAMRTTGEDTTTLDTRADDVRSLLGVPAAPTKRGRNNTAKETRPDAGGENTGA